MKKTRLLTLLLCLVMVLTSLSVPTEVFAASNKTPDSMTLNMKSKQTMYVGMSKKITVKSVKPKGSSKKVTFTSSNPSTVKVSKNGTMKALKAGKATITVTSTANADVQKQIKVTVKNLVKNKTNNKIVIPLDKKMKTAKLSTNEKVSGLKISSNKKKVATVSKKGVVTGKKAGIAKVTVKGKKGSAKGAKQVLTIYVAKKSVKTAALNAQNVKLNKGENFQLEVTVTPEEACNQSVYTSANEDVAAVDEDGKIVANQVGTTTITATTIDGKKKAECQVTVVEQGSATAQPDDGNAQNPIDSTQSGGTDAQNPSDSTQSGGTDEQNPSDSTQSGGTDEQNPSDSTQSGDTDTDQTEQQGMPTAIKLNQSSITLDYGKSATVRADISPDDAIDKTITWTSSNTAVAIVTDGAIFGIGEGDAVITATTANQLKATCAVHVNAPADGETSGNTDTEVVPVESVTFSKTEASLTPGSYIGLVVTINPENATDQNLILSSSNTSIATVVDQGLNSSGQRIAGIVAGFSGETYITALIGGKTATCKITVTKAEESPDYVVPYIATRYFNSLPTTQDNVVIPYYMTDYEQTEYVENNTSKKMNLVYEVDGTSNTQTGLLIGENELNLGKLSVGEHTIGIQAEDPETGRRSHKVYIDIKVAETTKNTYNVTETELSGTLESTLDMTDALNTLFEQKAAEGYGQVTLPKDGSYTIDGTNGGLKIPSGLTVDLNGSTIQMAVSTGTSAAIVTMDNVEDAHITNGILAGDKGESGASQAVGVRIRGGKYCTVTNMQIKNVSGNAYVTERVESTFSRQISDGEIKRKYTTSENKFVVSNTPFVDLTELKKESDYLMIGCNDYRKNVRSEKGMIYISFYDSSQNLLSTVEGYQHRKIKIPANAQYASAQFSGMLEGEDRMRFYFHSLGENLEVKNVQFENIGGTVILPTTFNNLLVKDCTFTNVGGKAFYVAEGDSEAGGWTEAQDLYYLNNKVTSGYKDIYVHTGRNFYFDNITGQNITFERGVLGGTICNMNDTGMTVSWVFGSAYMSGYARIFDNNCKNINVKHISKDLVFQPLPEYRIKNCTIAGDGFSSDLEAVEYVNCTFTNFKGDAGVLRGCTLNSDAEIGDDIIIYSK